MLSRLARFTYRRRRAVVVISVLFAALAATAGGPVAGLLKGGGFDDPRAENVAARDLIEKETGLDSSQAVIALVDAGAPVRTSPAAQAEVARVVKVLRADPGIGSVIDAFTTGTQALVSKDGLSTYIVAIPRAMGEDAEIALGKRLTDQLSGDPQVLLGGGIVAQNQVEDLVAHDLARAEAIAFPLLFLLLLVVFRGLVAALLPVILGGLAIVTAFLGLRIVNSFTDISIFALNLVTGLGLGLAIDYSLLVVSRYREESAIVGHGSEALRRTLSTAGRTVVFSSLTVAAAMAALLLFPQRFLYSMGLGGVLVTLASAAGALLVLPAVLAVLGKRLDSLSIRSRALHTTAVERGGWYRLAAFVLRRPVLIALVTATGLILLGLPFLRIQFTSVDASILPTSSSARQVSDRVDRDFVGHLLSPVQIVATAPASEAAQLTSYANNVARVSGIDGVLPPRMIGKGTWEIDALLRDDPLSVASPHTVKAVRALPHPFPVLVDGVTARFVDLQSSLAAHIPAALAVVIVATFVVVFAATGSLVLPLKSLLMNLLSISATFGALVLIFQDGRLQGLLQYQSQGALESTQPLLLFAVAFGLSTDYAVFLLLRIKEAHDAGAPTARAVALGLERTGRVVTAAALLFCVAIGAFATSQVVFIKEVGVGTALAVLIDATVVRALLVPALMALLGRWNWWAPRPLRRVHSALGLAHLELAATKTIAETAS